MLQFSVFADNSCPEETHKKGKVEVNVKNPILVNKQHSMQCCSCRLKLKQKVFVDYPFSLTKTT